VPHDTADPVAYLAICGKSRLGVATDLGAVTKRVESALSDLSALVLEFNHDVGMLADGPYPWPLKQRIRSRLGHLSNEEAASFLSGLDRSRLALVVLGHLSEVNNAPGQALAAAQAALGPPCPGRPRLEVAGQQDPTEVFDLP
jgi:phosphoribosyl 1,2-cyclic phosphodiesterase